MRAAVYQGIGMPHRVENVPAPQPGSRQVLLKVRRCGICGSDLAVTAPREKPTVFGSTLDALFAPGVVLGHEFAGEVVEVGREVTQLAVGDHVAPMFYSGCGRCLDCLMGKPIWCNHVNSPMGGYAQFALAQEGFCVKLPPALSWDDGALVEPLASALHTVTLARMQPGARVLILGAGAIGLGIAYFARRLGAGPIAVTARSTRGAELARAMGADFFVVQHPGLADEVADLLGGTPDVVFEAAGVSGLINQAIAAVRRGGTIVVAGINLDEELTAHAAGIMKEVRMQYAAAYENHDFEIVLRCLVEGGMPTERLVGQVAPLGEFPGLFESLRTDKRHCKVLVDPWG